MRHRLRAAALLLGALLLAGGFMAGCTPEEGFTPEGSPSLANPDYVRTPPPVQMPLPVGDNLQAVSKNDLDGNPVSCFIDFTYIDQGYIQAQYTGPQLGRLFVYKGDFESTENTSYMMPTDGSTTCIPLSMGNGAYSFKLTYYAGLDAAGQQTWASLLRVESMQVTVTDEFTMYLIPNQLVRYTENSNCVTLSHEITQHCGDNLEVVQQIYSWIADNISYDVEKAENSGVPVGNYEPDPDRTLAERKGICYDYSSLAAAMLRANGIPTIMVKGLVLRSNGTELYHAWNLVWLKEAGWIAVKLAVNPNDWTRIDVTFAAGQDSNIGAFIGNGENYTDLTYH
ncbi:transglutaminase-like domain-containing protein [Ruminococcaceae bacterium OttesenSCG-928-O06]|nr:transglutaminase-like domain-containing protein [Ruminococcaceae bacterium OttesenSCG-928-O06]